MVIGEVRRLDDVNESVDLDGMDTNLSEWSLGQISGGGLSLADEVAGVVGGSPQKLQGPSKRQS